MHSGVVGNRLQPDLVRTWRSYALPLHGILLCDGSVQQQFFSSGLPELVLLKLLQSLGPSGIQSGYSWNPFNDARFTDVISPERTPLASFCGLKSPFLHSHLQIPGFADNPEGIARPCDVSRSPALPPAASQRRDALNAGLQHLHRENEQD